MSTSKDTNLYQKLFQESGFIEKRTHENRLLGEYYYVPKESGGGYFWIYSLADQYAIKIHNFYFHDDIVADFPGHEGLSICYYYSVSGEELDPYRRIPAGQVRFLNYIDYHFKAIIHKKIPIQTVEIELYSGYYEKFISEKFGDVEFDFDRLFRNIDWCTDFPEMEKLLSRIWNYEGDGIAAKLFYDSMVSQAISLIIEYNSHKTDSAHGIYISEEDRRAIDTVNKYLNDHFSGDVSTDKLCRIACFGKTKFKTLFKEINHCTVTEYVTEKRLSQAESLLSSTNLTIEQIATAVGYSNPSRFAALFKKNTGLFPSDYRKMSK